MPGQKGERGEKVATTIFVCDKSLLCCHCIHRDALALLVLQGQLVFLEYVVTMVFLE